VIAVLLLTLVLIFPLPAVCMAGPVLDRIGDRRLARRRLAADFAPYRPYRIAEWTGRTWMEVPCHA
jgi:hypothetical protein